MDLTKKTCSICQNEKNGIDADRDAADGAPQGRSNAPGAQPGWPRERKTSFF